MQETHNSWKTWMLYVSYMAGYIFKVEQHHDFSWISVLTRNLTWGWCELMRIDNADIMIAIFAADIRVCWCHIMSPRIRSRPILEVFVSKILALQPLSCLKASPLRLQQEDEGVKHLSDWEMCEIRKWLRLKSIANDIYSVIPRISDQTEEL